MHSVNIKNLFKINGLLCVFARTSVFEEIFVYSRLLVSNPWIYMIQIMIQILYNTGYVPTKIIPTKIIHQFSIHFLATG